MKPLTIFIILFAILTTQQSLAQSSDVSLSEFSARRKASLDMSSRTATQAPGTNVFLVPPDRFEANSEINGFIHKGSATSIQIIEIPDISSSTVTSSLTKAYFEKQGFSLEKKENITLNSEENGVIYITSYIINEQGFYRIFFFTGQKNTIWININFPDIVKGLLYEPIIASLKTVYQNEK